MHGTDIPDPVSTFEELQKEYDLDPRVIQNIKAAGFQTPTPIQMQAIPLMMHVCHVSDANETNVFVFLFLN